MTTSGCCLVSSLSKAPNARVRYAIGNVFAKQCIAKQKVDKCGANFCNNKSHFHLE